MLDARGWSEAHIDDASLATLIDEVEREQMPLIRKDLGEEIARVAVLAEIVGSRAKLEELWTSTDFTTA